ncbi:MAG: hypothetical protein GXO10_03930 [Crenarchaeota archaeon]|nr:hypothetical protein [Thermoproteota archaeon]
MIQVRDCNNLKILKYRETPVILLENKDLPFIENAELLKALSIINIDNPKILFISRHEMLRNPRPMLTVHTSGNWNKAEYGGIDNEVSICNACLNSNIIRQLRKLAEERELVDEYEVVMEATHHGPSIDYESCFIEVGSSEREWNDERCINLFIDLIEDILARFKDYLKKIGKVTVSIGDLHYCTLMNHIFNLDIDLGHTIPKYVSITEKNVKDAITKTVPFPERVIIHWKSLKKEIRDLVLKVIDENYKGVEVIKRK